MTPRTLTSVLLLFVATQVLQLGQLSESPAGRILSYAVAALAVVASFIEFKRDMQGGDDEGNQQ